MFNWSEDITLPKLTDVFNFSELPVAFLRVFTYVWVWFLGGWFFAGIIGVLAGILYLKYDNALVPISFLIVMLLFFGEVLTAVPSLSSMPPASIFLYVVGILAAFGIGIALYMLFINKG